MSNYGLIGMGNTPNTYMPNGTLNAPQGILSQEETQKVLINRAGNRGLNFDPWEGFESVRKMDNNLTNLPKNYPQPEVSKFLENRGGNRGLFLNPKNAKIISLEPSNTNSPMKYVQEGFEDIDIWTPNATLPPGMGKFKKEPQFYPGDKVLSGNFFNGWNDSFFFQTSLFRENNEFWANPYKEPIKSLDKF